jgi:hypothetical protein
MMVVRYAIFALNENTPFWGAQIEAPSRFLRFGRRFSDRLSSPRRKPFVVLKMHAGVRVLRLSRSVSGILKR